MQKYNRKTGKQWHAKNWRRRRTAPGGASFRFEREERAQVRQKKQRKDTQVLMSLQSSFWKREECGTRSVFAGTALTTSRQNNASRKRTTQSGKDLIRQKTSRSRLWAAYGSDGFIKRMWERLTIKKRSGKAMLKEAARAVQLDTDSTWQSESTCKKELKLLRMGNECLAVGRLLNSSRFHDRKSGRLG